MRGRSLFWSLKETTRDQLQDSFGWLLYSLAGSTLPIWLGGLVLLPIFSKRFDWIEYGKNGEFALYSAAILAPTLRLIAKDVANFEFVRRQTFLFFGWILLAGSVAIYSAVITTYRIGQETATLNAWLMVVMSLGLYSASVLFSFVVTLIDSQRVPPTNVREIAGEGATRLEQAFDKMVDSSQSEAENEPPPPPDEAQ